jgi:uncharacterized protein YndB with AHSA1/START domain
MSSMEPPPSATLVVRRILPAPVEAVYEAWTNPDLVRQWSWGSRHETTAMRMDVRPGGSWHHEIRNLDNGERWTFDGVFEEVIPGRKLVHTFFWRSGSGVEEGPSLVAIEFIDRDAQSTEVVITHNRVAENSRSGTRDGWLDILELVGTLAGRAQARISP